MKWIVLTAVVFLYACSDNMPEPKDMAVDLSGIAYNPVPYELNVPEGFPIFENPEDNALTLDGVDLGRHLFYDPIMSLDSTISCATCHLPEFSFTDQLPKSIGIHGEVTRRSSMSLVNVGFYYNGLFWDGRSPDLEEQAIHPIIDEIEMDNTWDEVIVRLRRSDKYREKFRKAFGIPDTDGINRRNTVKALAQFERTLVSSGDSKFDKVMKGQAVFTEEEQLGFDIFFDADPELPDGECFHCHSAPLFTNNDYMNNGLIAAEEFEDFTDKGRGEVTGNRIDNGKFRVPTLRNIEYTAPYMHNGSLATLEEVLDHYNSGGQISQGKDALLVPLGLDETQLQALRAFLSTLNDEDFIQDERYQDPNG